LGQNPTGGCPAIVLRVTVLWCFSGVPDPLVSALCGGLVVEADLRIPPGPLGGVIASAHVLVDAAGKMHFEDVCGGEKILKSLYGLGGNTIHTRRRVRSPRPGR